MGQDPRVEHSFSHRDPSLQLSYLAFQISLQAKRVHNWKVRCDVFEHFRLKHLLVDHSAMRIYVLLVCRYQTLLEVWRRVVTILSVSLVDWRIFTGCLVEMRLAFKLAICIGHCFGARCVVKNQFISGWQLLVQIYVVRAWYVSRNVKFVV